MNKSDTSIHISYAITVCNEASDLERLILAIRPYLQEGDELIVQADKDHVTEDVKTVCNAHNGTITCYYEHALNMDFAQAKNHLNDLCHGDWIFQLDADELPDAWLLKHLRHIIQKHPFIELFKFPRINIFNDELGNRLEDHVAWPDYQGRLYRNKSRIQWRRPLHERIHGHFLYWHLPKQDRYAIHHRKVKAQDKNKWLEWQQHYNKA